MTSVWISSFALRGPFEKPKKYNLNPKLRFYQLFSAEVKNYRNFNLVIFVLPMNILKTPSKLGCVSKIEYYCHVCTNGQRSKIPCHQKPKCRTGYLDWANDLVSKTLSGRNNSSNYPRFPQN